MLSRFLQPVIGCILTSNDSVINLLKSDISNTDYELEVSLMRVRKQKANTALSLTQLHGAHKVSLNEITYFN